MKKRETIIRVLGMLLLLFFVLEYLEPSTIGIRTGVVPLSEQPSGQGKSPEWSKLSLSASHAMICGPSLFSEQGENRVKLQPVFLSILVPLFPDEIFHPPLSSL